MRDENHDLRGGKIEQRLEQAVGNAAQTPVGVDESGASVEADSHEVDDIVRSRRVLHVAMATVRGGLLRVVESLAAEQACRGHVIIASPLPPRANASGRVGWRELHLRGNADLGGHRHLFRLLLEEEPDVTVLHAGSPGELALAAALVSRRCPAAILEHAPHHYPLRRRLRDPILVRLKRRAQRWLAVSEVGARHLERCWSLPERTIGVVYCGVPPPLEGAYDEEVEGAVLGCGRPVEAKGYDAFRAVAVRFAAMSDSPRFVWIGAAATGRDGPVELLPWRDDLAPALAACRMILLPSHFEGLPLTLLEAWAAGAPVLATPVGGIPEVVRDGVDAALVPQGDVNAWVSAVQALLEDEPRARMLAAGGRARWGQDYTVAAMASRWEAEFASMGVVS